MTPHLELVQFYSPEQVAAIFGQFRNGAPDKRWVYRHAERGEFLYLARRKRSGETAKTLLFDRREIDRIVAEFRAPSE